MSSGLNQSNTFPSLIAGAIHTNQIFIEGRRFRDVIQSLISEDVLEQEEINDLRNLLTYLNTSALTQSWVVNNDNRNAVLKTLITAIETKLANIDTTALSQTSVLTNENRNSVLKTAIDDILTKLTNIDTSSLTQLSVLTDDNRNSVLKTAIDNLITKLANIDTTALTQSSILTDDNRNSVLKTRLDSNDGSLTDLSNKTRFINEIVVGNNTADPKVPNKFSLNVNTSPIGIHKGDLRIEAGFNLIRMQNNSQTLQDLNYQDNKMDIFSPNGMITTYAHLNRIQAQNKIEIGDIGINNSAEINIGGKAAQINIGSKDEPDAFPANNTIIKIGTRGIRNTETYLQGNIYTDEGRFEDLDVSDVVNWWTAASWASGFVFTGVPYWIAWVALSGTPNYRYSDVVKMANNYLTGGLTKNKSIETSNDLALKAITIVNTDLVSLSTPFDGLLNRLVFQAFAVHGSHSIGTIWGKVNMYCGNGEIELRNDGSVFDWAFKNAGNANQLLIKNLDVELIQCNGSDNDGKLTLGACNGNIDLITGSSGNRSAATKVMEIKSNKQVLIGNNSAMVDNTYKVLVDATSHTNGIKVAKGSDALLLNPTNVSSKSITLQDTYTGTTTKTLYTNANDDLMYNGEKVAVGSIPASSGGLTYIILAPTNTSLTHANQVLTSLSMSPTYSTAPIKTATLSAYNVNTNYQITSILGAIPKSANPILSGTYELNQFVNFSAAGNDPAYLYAKLYFTGLPLNDVVINKTYISPAGSGNVFNLTTPEIKVPANDVSITIAKVIFPSVSIGGPEFQFTILTLTLIDQQGTILHTFPTQGAASNTTFDKVFERVEGPITITDTTNITGLRFNLSIDNSTGCVLNQTVAQDAINARYILEGSIRMLLYDGTTNPTTLTHNAVALYALSLPFPTTPFVITDYENPNITLEEWFIQPTGTTSNHSVSLQFNDGALSHFHTSIASVSATPTLSSIMIQGNSVGNTDLNMNGQDITNADVITANTITPTAITGWNVKSLTAGSGISATNNGSGDWTITNTSVPITPTIAQVLSAGSVASNQNLSGINTLTATTITPTNITGWNVKQITGGTDIVVSSDQYGNYTVSYDGAGSAYEASHDDYTITAAATNAARRPTHYGNSWYPRSEVITSENTCADIFMSSNGKVIAIAHRETSNNIPRAINYSTNYGTTFFSGNTSKNWISIAGTTTGDAIWAIQGGITTNNSPYPREVWRSNDRGATWTQQSSPPDFTTSSNPNRIRVSADGKFQIITDPRTGSLGKIYKSSDYGATWVSQNITNAQSTATTCAISATGQVQYVKISGTSGGTHANNNNGGIYRSTNYGGGWAYVNNTDPLYYIDCDATGRIVIASTDNGVITSRDYGLTWRSFTIALATAVSVSPNGNNIWVGCINQTSTTELYYSDDFGLSFTVKNINPVGSYITTNYTQIKTNYDGSVVVGGGSGKFNSYSLNPNEVSGLNAGSGITITTTGEGTYTIASTGGGGGGSSNSTSIFLDQIFLSPNTNLVLPVTMDLFKYDYELDFTMENVLGTQPWFFLRFNLDVGLTGWASTLFFNPSSSSGGTSVSSSYTNTSVGNQIYWLNGGICNGNMTLKATYRMSAISATQFVVYLVQSQPANIVLATNFNANYLVYATQIFYNYSSNNPWRWCPSHFNIVCSTANSFNGGRCVIRQVIKSSSYL